MRWATAWSLYFGGRSSTVRAVVLWTAILPVVVVVGRLSHSPTGLPWVTAAVVGVLLVIRTRRSEVPLSREAQRRVSRAVLTGTTTGDWDLDTHALRTLDRRRRINGRSEHAALVVVGSTVAAAPVVASQISSLWWLATLPIGLAVAVTLVPYLMLDTDESIRQIEASNKE